MTKSKSAFFCKECGAQSAQWMGRCPSCGEWNTLVEEVIAKSPRKGNAESRFGSSKSPRPKPISEVDPGSLPRIPIPDEELARVLGDGLVPGSVVLLGGEPGIGKSTLLLQMALRMQGVTTLYVSGEESDGQIRMRAGRIGIINPECYILNEVSVPQVLERIAELKPGLVIIDSIQTLQSEQVDSTPGSISQIRESAAELQRMAKLSGIPVMLIGHITKDGSLAGPKLLEHMVDTVLSFEGDGHHGYRIIRSLKNRFGSTSELGIYEMTTTGLREVSDPSEILLSPADDTLGGVAVGACIEGLRTLMTEAQALVSPSAYGTAQRSSNGFDIRRLHMLLAVLEKRGGFRLGNKDVFLNITGGLRIDDPAADLAVVAAILSSDADIPVPSKTCFAGEVGLSGEIRHVGRMVQRISEAERLGFSRIFIPSVSAKGLGTTAKIEIVKVDRISAMADKLF